MEDADDIRVFNLLLQLLNGGRISRGALGLSVKALITLLSVELTGLSVC